MADIFTMKRSITFYVAKRRDEQSLNARLRVGQLRELLVEIDRDHNADDDWTVSIEPLVDRVKVEISEP